MTLSFHLSVELGMEDRESPVDETHHRWVPGHERRRLEVAAKLEWRRRQRSDVPVDQRVARGGSDQVPGNRRPSALNAASVAGVTATG